MFALLAYGEVAAFYRLTDEARMAPNLLGRINMASMAAAEMTHYELLHDALEKERKAKESKSKPKKEPTEVTP